MRRLLLLAVAVSLAQAGYDAASVSGAWLIDGYKKVFSPLQGPNMCNFWPTCSQFTKSAIEARGILPGMVMGADRLMRCNVFAWTYQDKYYFGTSHDRMNDPLQGMTSGQAPMTNVVSGWVQAPISGDGNGMPVPMPQPDLAFAEHLYACRDYAEAAHEFLRIRFAVAEASTKAYAGLMAGESYLAAEDPARALKAFGDISAPRISDFARYGSARALFARGQLPDARRLLDSVTGAELRRNAGYLAGWTWFREMSFDRGAACFVCWPDDSLALQLAQLDGRRMARRSRALSTVLSAAVPGLGQVYSGRIGDGIYTFLTVASSGLLTYWFAAESETRDRTHIKVSVFGAVTALFYAGNVYGASVAARDYNQLQERRYLESAEVLLARLKLEPDYGPLRDSLPAARE